MIEINLLPEELKAKAKIKAKPVKPKEVHVSQASLEKVKYLFYLIPLILGGLLIAHILLACVAIFKNNQLGMLNNKWRTLEPQRKMLADFSQEYAAFSEDEKTVLQAVQQRVGWAEKLNKLSLYLPSGIWFNAIKVSEGNFVLDASVISLQKDEMGLINKLIESLKADPGFFKDFSSLGVGSVNKRTVASFEIADFVLSGKLNEDKRTFIK